jgi:hypothetical protein
MVDLNDPIYEFLRDDRVFLLDHDNEDRVDPRLPWSFATTRQRDRLAGALRQLADVFTSRHDLPIPKDGYVRLDVVADGERRVAEISHGPKGYLFQVLPGAFEEPAATKTGAARNAPRLAASDSPAAEQPPQKTTAGRATAPPDIRTPRRRGR